MREKILWLMVRFRKSLRRLARTKTGRRVKNFLLVCSTYIAGVVWGVVFEAFRAGRIIRVEHFERLPPRSEKRIILGNHPSMIDPPCLAGLFFWEYVFHPLKRLVIMADEDIFCKPWYFFWALSVIVPVKRGDRRREGIACLQAITLVEQLRALVLCPEGTRTCNVPEDQRHHSSKGKKLGPLKGGIGLIALRTKALIVPVWIEGTNRVVPNSKKSRWTRFSWRRLFRRGITIKIGNPIKPEKFAGKNREEVTQLILSALLALADE